MIFRADLADAVMRGEKTVTRRLCSDNPRSPWWREKCGYRVGQEFTINPGRGVPNIGSAVVKGLCRQRLGHPDDDEARREGFDSAAAFEEAFAGINGTYDPTVEVWRIEFAAVGLPRYRR